MAESKEEFEQGYADRSGMTLQKLLELGGHGEPCECDYEKCRGWQMVFPERVTIKENPRDLRC